MPLPILLGPAAVVSLKAAATVAMEYGPAISSVSLGALLARQAWTRIPSWIKQDEAFRSLVANETDNEVLSLAAIIEKLQALVAIGSEKVSEDQSSLELWQMQAALLCYIRLNMQLKERYPTFRDELHSSVDLLAEEEHNSNHTSGNLPCNNDDWVEIQQTLDFAIWAYDQDTENLRQNLEAIDFFLVDHTLTINLPPGHVTHFVAICPEQKTLIISVQGTSTLEDLVIDCVGRAITYEMDSMPFEKDLYCTSKEDILVTEQIADDDMNGLAVEVSQHNGIRIRCHEGILLSAKRLADKVFDVVYSLADYRILLCGHSLGAGVACLLGILLKARLSSLTSLHIYSFACPPVLDYGAAMACVPFCTSMVNHSDMIPRCSLANLRSLLHVLRGVHERMEDQGLSPSSPTAALALFHHLSQGTQGELLMSHEETQSSIHMAQARVGIQDVEHLYVPGRVLFLYEPALLSVSSSSSSLSAEIQCFVTTGSASPLRWLELDGSRMVTDHLTASYVKNVSIYYASRFVSAVSPKSHILGTKCSTMSQVIS